MDYFSILKLDKEPFSNSPDPSFFFKSQQHQDCLQKVELALRLKRGLNVVMGDVGTGKTTLCRQLIRRFRNDDTVDTHLILDPGFDTPLEFLSTVAGMLSDDSLTAQPDTWQLKESIKNHLYHLGVDQGRTVILIFDEGQKLPDFVIELLREFLNYETNTQKLLQIAIFAQCEFEAVLNTHANFADRVNLLHRLEPMSFRDTREMIRFRLKQSSTSPKPLPLFTYPAMWAIYRFSRGYPRKIINLCHQSLLAMIIQNRTKAGLMLVRSCVRRAISHPARRIWRPLTTFLALILILVVIGALIPEPYSPMSHLLSGIRSRPWVSVHPVGNTLSSAEISAKTGGAVPREATPPLQGNSDASDPDHDPAGPSGVVDADAPRIKDASFMEEPEAVAPPEPLSPVALPPDESAAAATVSATVVPPSPTAIRQIREATGSQTSQPNTVPPYPSTATAAARTPRAGQPLLLGRLRVASGDTIVQLVRQIRGNYDPAYVTNLLALNPHIKDPDSIAIDDEIIFPASPVKVSPLIDEIYWLQLDQGPSLSQAHLAYRAYRNRGFAVHLVPFWTALEGLRFVVLAAETFTSEAAVLAKIETLPATLAATSSVRSQWGQRPVFFASPF
ncbi:MAG: AAA family ATPase [Desulfosarcinaceae bacterium]|nr:AAA family ATPase [Desulfosarcinaceae bacterium]